MASASPDGDVCCSAGMRTIAPADSIRRLTDDDQKPTFRRASCVDTLTWYIIGSSSPLDMTPRRPRREEKGYFCETGASEKGC